MHISGWRFAATPAAADIFIQHSKVAALLSNWTPAVSKLTASWSPPGSDSAQVADGRSVVMILPAVIEPAAPSTWLTICCPEASNEVRTVRPGSVSDGGAQRQDAICWAERATDQTRTSYSWPTKPVAEPNPAPSWKVPAACCAALTVSRSAVATPSL